MKELQLRISAGLVYCIDSLILVMVSESDVHLCTSDMDSKLEQASLAIKMRGVNSNLNRFQKQLSKQSINVDGIQNYLRQI